MPSVYYNENDPYAAAWLGRLMDNGLIPEGEIDERSIVDVRASDVSGFDQCHFFAGIGGWPYALDLAGWPRGRSVWTGSCPCQPFSAAGKRRGFADERHLWPVWKGLIEECRPAIVFGEQVEAAVGWGWLDAVFADLEAEGYACGATVLPACGIGAPHIRQRAWFVADAECGTAERRGHDLAGSPDRIEGEARERERIWNDSRASGVAGAVAHANGRDASAEGLQRGGEHGQQPQDGRALQLGNADRAGSQGRRIDRNGSDKRAAGPASMAGDLANAAGGGLGEFGDATQPRRSGHADRGFWACDWLPCTDGKARPVRPGSFPLAHGIQRRTSKLRAYGNAIVPQVAAQFIRAVM